MKIRIWPSLFALFLTALTLSCQHGNLAPQNPTTTSNEPESLKKIDHVIVIYLENHSFHNLFAEFPGTSNPLPEGYEGQRDKNGQLYRFLPAIDSRFPKNLPNKAFPMDPYVGLKQKTPDPVHEFYTCSLEIDGGKMDLFTAYSRVGGLTQGYYNMKSTALWHYASEFTLNDRFFQSAFGGSFLNHQWLIAARTPYNGDAPENMRTILEPDGKTPKKFGIMTTDGYAVNSIQPLEPPYDPHEKNELRRLPPLTYENIGDRLSDKNISWAWFSGGWDEASAGKAKSDFQFHHQPFVYFKNYGPNTPGRRDHLKDEKDFFASVENKQLPQVSFIKPTGDENAHPGYSDVDSADGKLRKMVEAVQHSSYWDHSLIIVTFDEYGGFWDPIAPPTVDRWGPGPRIPAIFISPLVKKHYVDHTPAETISILALIEAKFSLPALTERDAQASKMFEVFE